MDVFGDKMGNYDILLKYIELCSTDDIGEWFIDKENDGSMAHPIQLPFVVYSKNVNDFIEDVQLCAEQNSLKNYREVLNQHGIEWGSESMCSADVALLPSEAILALLLGAVRAEKFCDGALLGFFKDGSIQKWLKELKTKEEIKNMSCIKIDDLLKISVLDAKNVKVKFNQNDGNEDPMDLYLRNPEIVNSQWLFWRNKQRYFNIGQIAICLLKLSYDTWLLTTIKRVTEEFGVLNGINYKGEELKEYRQYFGRVIIKYHKTAQTQGMFYNTVCDALEVLEILPNVYDGDEFPGYDKVRLSYVQLKSIMERQKKSWIAALENQKAVYLITDKSNGRLYVGSATSDNGMLLARWSSYAENGHGGNVELKKLVDEHGFDHVKKYFQYSILENYNAKVDDHVILDRESWWKETLQSRKFGYNDN